jgi:HK97 family phage major capsid protein
VKAIDGSADSSGGYAVPQEIDMQIAATLASISPIRAIANVVTVGSAGYRKLVTSGGTTSGCAAEDAVRAETGTPVFNEVAPPMGDLFANPAATQGMLDDMAFDLEAWLAGEIATEFARAEGAAFVKGDGVNKPKGFLAVPRSAAEDGTRAFGTIQYLPTGVDGAFPASEPEDLLVDLVQSLRAPYARRAAGRLRPPAPDLPHPLRQRRQLPRRALSAGRRSADPNRRAASAGGRVRPARYAAAGAAAGAVLDRRCRAFGCLERPAAGDRGLH